MTRMTGAEKIKVGIIGCGYWGPKLARNFNESQGASLAGVADFREDRLSHMRELYPQALFTSDYKDLLASDVSAVVIATPVSTHHPLAMAALKAGKHILIEKPIAGCTAHAKEIAETADTLGLSAMVGHTFQYNPAVNVIRDLVRTGELGQVLYVDATRVNLGLLQPDINVVWDLAPHDISILLHVLGVMPAAVSGTGAVYVQKGTNRHEVAYLHLYFPNDVLATVRLSWLDPVKIRQITIVGARKMLVYDDIADNKVVLFDKGVDLPPYSDTIEEFTLSYRHGAETVVPVAWREPLRIECEAFLESIRTSRPAPSDAWMGVKVVQVLDAAQRSMTNGGHREEIRYE